MPDKRSGSVSGYYLCAFAITPPIPLTYRRSETGGPVEPRVDLCRGVGEMWSREERDCPLFYAGSLVGVHQCAIAVFAQDPFVALDAFLKCLQFAVAHGTPHGLTGLEFLPQRSAVGGGFIHVFLLEDTGHLRPGAQRWLGRCRLSVGRRAGGERRGDSRLLRWGKIRRGNRSRRKAYPVSRRRVFDTP